VRLCLITDSYPSTTQTFVYEPVEWLRAAGHRVDVITSRRSEAPGTTPATHPALVVPPWRSRPDKVRLALASPARTAAAVPAALEWRRRSSWSVAEIVTRAAIPELAAADYVVAHFGPTGAAWLPVAAAARRPYAVYFHGYDATSYPRERPAAYAGLVASGAAALTNSGYLRSVLVGLGFAEPRIGVIPYGISADLVKEREPAPLAGSTLLTIARLVPKKGLDDSLRAFAAAQPALRGGWRYRIVGDGPLLEELRALARSLGVADLVEFSGFLSRAATLAALREASIFVLASKTPASGDTEGTPVSILEAAALGLPVLSTRHAGIPELLPEGADREGYLVPEGDVAGLAAAMARLGESLERRRSWGERCRAFVRARHSPAAHVSEFLAALERLADVPRWPG